MSAPTIPGPRLLIEAAFASWISRHANKPNVTAIVRGSDSSVEVVVPYVMAWCEGLEQRGRGYFVAKMQAILVTNMDDTNTDKRADLAGNLFACVRDPQAFTDGQVAILGWTRPIPREASDGQEKGDAFIFTAGIQVAG